MTEQMPEAVRAIGAACDYLEIDTLNEPEAEDILADLTAAGEAFTLVFAALNEARAALLRCGEEPGWATGNWAPKRQHTTGGMWDRLDAAIAAASGEKVNA